MSTGMAGTATAFGAIATQEYRFYEDDQPGYLVVFDGYATDQLTTEDAVLRFDGPTPWSGVGLRADLPGDVDGDGVDDLIVGSHTHGERSADNLGAVWLFSPTGPTELVPADAVQTFLGTPGQNLGSITVARDVTGDETPELLVNARDVVFLFDATSAGTQTTDDALAAYADVPGTQGWNGLLVADLDADGELDALVGRGSAVGAAWGPQEDWRLEEWLDVDDLGGHGMIYRLVVGDWNDDGQDDLAVANHVADGPAGYRVGRVAVFFGPMDRDDPQPADVELFGEQAQAFAGLSLTAGDFDGDGVDDLAHGAIDFTGALPGRVYVHLGPLTADTTPALVVLGHHEGDRFGSDLAACDLDQDGRDELVVGAHAWSDADWGQGRIDVLDLPL